MIGCRPGRRGVASSACRAVVVLCVMLVLGAVRLCAQEAAIDSARADSAQAIPPRPDSAQIAVHPPDSARSIDYGAPLGSMVGRDDQPGLRFITKRDLVWERYTTSYDALALRLPARGVSMGNAGQVRAFSYAGAAPEAIPVAYNGRPLEGARGGFFSLDLYPTEFLERIEILRGAQAAALGSGESLIALNIVEPRYNSAGSYVRLWFAQAPTNTTNTDVTFARNIGGRSNIALGFRRMVSDGIYSSGNQRVSGWSVRGAVRYDAGPGFSLSLTEIFTDATRGASGGLTVTSDRDPLLATVWNDTLSEREIRHDLTLAARWYPVVATPSGADSARGTIPDTTTRFDAALYYSYVESGLVVGDRPAGIGLRTAEGLVGARLGATTGLGVMRLAANGSIQRGPVSGVRADAGGLLELDVEPVMVLRAGLKLSENNRGTYLTAVGEAVARLGDSASLRGTLRQTSLLREPVDCIAIVAPLDQDSVRSLGAHYTSVMGEAEFLWRADRWRFALNGAVRIARPFVCRPFSNYTVTTFSATVGVPLGFLSLDNHVVATLVPELYRAFPLLHGVSDLSTRFQLFEGNLDLKLGTAVEYQTGPALLTYDDAQREFNAPRENPYPDAKPPFPNWGVYAQARIGNAYLRAEFRNLLDVEFSTLYRYPAFGRGFYLGVNWALID